MSSGATMPDGFEVIVERTLTARERVSGNDKKIYVVIGKPSWTIQGEEASCPVLVKGLHYE